MTRVLVVDDHDYFRGCLVDLLSSTPDLVAVGECRDGSGVLEAVRALRPDVVLLDVQMPVRNGFEAAGDLHAAREAARVILLSAEPVERCRARAEGNGVVGHVPKGAPGGQVLAAVRRVASGGTAWSDDVPPHGASPW
jgi:DNA-binding NarL/FixJ family response regulator